MFLIVCGIVMISFMGLQNKKSSYGIRNCLIFFVDQPGLEPGTSRL